MVSAGVRKTMRLRAAFISDVHLGSRECRAAQLLDFLRSIEVDYLFLVGDIVDLWALRKNFYWPQEHNEVFRALLGKAKAGTRVIYIPGNHDEELREFCGSVFGKLEIHREFVHETADGRQLLVLHGDEFDAVVKCSPWLAVLGSTMYGFLLWLNRCVNFARRRLGLPYWSLATWLKLRIGNAARHVDAFERAAAHVAARRGLDGIVCGHIHRATMRDVGGVDYCNDGDWVENCTAVVEEMSGRLELRSWTEDSNLADREKYLEAVA